MSRISADGISQLSFEGNRHAWAVREVYTDIDGTVCDSLLGVYCFRSRYSDRAVGSRPAYCAATTAFFRTRDMARSYLKMIGSGFDSKSTRRSVVKVQAEVEVLS